MIEIRHALVLAETPSAWYVVACVAIPLAWGLATEFVFRFLEHRRRKSAGDFSDNWQI